MPGGMDTTDRMDNRNIEDRNLKKRIELLERNLEDTKNDLIDAKNTFKKIMIDLTKLIDSRIEIYMDKLNGNNSNKKSQTELVEPKKIEDNEVEEKDIKEEINEIKEIKEIKEKKLDISKFIEVFSQEFDFINKDEFNEEMENDEIMNKIIELIKKMLGIKDNEISEKKIEIDGLKINKAELEKDIQEKENKNNLLESKKIELEGEIKSINHKVNELETSKNKLEKDIENLNKEKSNLDKDLEKKKNEIIRLEGIEKDLESKNSKLIEEKERLNRENKEKEKELESIGDLLEVRKLYDKYLSMEARILSKLDNVLIQRDFESFISSGYTLSSLDNVWDIVKIEYKNISNEDKETLKEVFAFFLSQINKRFKEAKYGLVQVEVGEDFDAVNQVDLIQNSKGRVTECVFYGYGFLKEKENPNDENIISRIIKSPLVLTA